MIIINNAESPTEKMMNSRDPSTKTNRSSRSSKKRSGSRRSSRNSDKSGSSSSPKSSSAPQSPIERSPTKPSVSKNSTYSIGAGKDKEGNDHFPDLLNFDDDSFTDLTDIDTDDEFAIAAQKEKYTSKVNQDVAVFLALAERMSMESLIFILQGQAAGLSPNIKTKPSKANNKKQEEASKASKAKKFRFAEVAGNKVREVVHEVDSYKDMDLWWSDEEMRSMRTDAIKIVKFYSKHVDHYVNAVEEVFVGGEKDQTKIASQLKVLVDESYVRGFEAHIVTLLNDRRELFCRAILALADELHSRDYETSSKILGEASEKHSVLAKEFALRLGQIDHLEALKSSLSR